MNKPDLLNMDALLQRIEELEKENRLLRTQLQEQNRHTQAEAKRHGVAAQEHAEEIRSADSRFDSLLDSHNALLLSKERLLESERRAHTSERQLRQITDNLPALIAYVDVEQRYRFNNKAYETWVRRSPEELYGMRLIDAVGELTYNRAKPYIERVLKGEHAGHEWWAAFPSGMRFVRSEYIPDRRDDGSIAGFFVLASDLTEFKQSQEALSRIDARLRLAIDAGHMAIWESETATRSITASPELNKLLGFPEDASPTSDEIRSRYAPGERRKLHRVAVEAAARGDRYAETELKIIWPDGSQRSLLLRAELIGIANGIPSRVVGVALDITEIKKAEEHQQLLINELNHRVKNTLTTVQSIVSQSLRNADTATAAREAVEGRLFALSRAHDVLTRENWDGAYLREVVFQAIEPFQQDRGNRFDIEGEDVRLPPRIALAIAMAIQELGTNAVKYGALSNDTGSVRIAWLLTAQAAKPRLEMSWQEMGGPPVVTPERRGFGTRLIERSLAQELAGSVEITFEPTGVICSINAPLAPDEGDEAQL